MLRYTYNACLVNFTLRVTSSQVTQRKLYSFISQKSEGLNYTAAEISGSRIVAYVDGKDAA